MCLKSHTYRLPIAVDVCQYGSKMNIHFFLNMLKQDSMILQNFISKQNGNNSLIKVNIRHGEVKSYPSLSMLNLFVYE